MNAIRRGLAVLSILSVLVLAAGCAKQAAESTAPAPPPATAAEPPPPPAPPAPPPATAAEPPPPPACLQQALAPFPWPDVPRPTAQRVIVRDLLQPLPATLGDALALLRSELRAAGYPPPPVLGAGCNGFALVLEGERVRPDGRRIGFEQWGQSTRISVGEILRQLFTAAPGLYRMIVVVVSTERPLTTAETLSARQLEGLAAQGSSELPPPMAALPFDARYEVRALVYEFVRDEGGAAQVPPDGRIPIVTHLQQAGLLQRGPR